MCIIRNYKIKTNDCYCNDNIRRTFFHYAGGRTSHLRFKVPINADDSSLGNISKQNGIAELLRRAKLIIWDEAPMAKQWVIETFDRTLKDIMDSRLLFGGKVIVFGGDFHQVLPVVRCGTKAKSINVSLVSSYLWPKMEKLRLSINMRTHSNSNCTDFLLRVRNGEVPMTSEDMIKIPNEMLIKYNDDENLEDCLINDIFLSLKENAHLA